MIKAQYGILSQAAELVASPQIRNQGTLGGNVSQDVRCWYYRGGWPCYRAAATFVIADTPVGRNREHAIFGRQSLRGRASIGYCACIDCARRQVRVPDFKRPARGGCGRLLPGAGDRHYAHQHSCKPGDLLTAIRLPAAWAGAKFYFEKVRDRNVWDFPLMNVASAMVMQGNTIDRIRLGGERGCSKAHAPEGCGRRGEGQAGGRGDGRNGRQPRSQGCRSAAIQRIQDSVDAQPGEALDQSASRRRNGPDTVGNQSVGKNGSHPYCVVPDLGLPPSPD